MPRWSWLCDQSIIGQERFKKKLHLSMRRVDGALDEMMRILLKQHGAAGHSMPSS